MTLREYIARDKRMSYYPFFSKEYLLDYLLRPDQYYVRTFVKSLRSEEYYTTHKKNKLLKYYYFRKKNILGARIGLFISAGVFAPGLKIYHWGAIMVHPKAKIGINCTIHGSCCIGNNGKVDSDDAPVIGDNVDIGMNAQILGKVTIADGVRIGAGAVVVKSILIPGVRVAGVPARILE